jgi:hypothetical protein
VPGELPGRIPARGDTRQKEGSPTPRRPRPAAAGRCPAAGRSRGRRRPSAPTGGASRRRRWSGACSPRRPGKVSRHAPPGAAAVARYRRRSPGRPGRIWTARVPPPRPPGREFRGGTAATAARIGRLSPVRSWETASANLSTAPPCQCRTVGSSGGAGLKGLPKRQRPRSACSRRSTAIATLSAVPAAPAAVHAVAVAASLAAHLTAHSTARAAAPAPRAAAPAAFAAAAKGRPVPPPPHDERRQREELEPPLVATRRQPRLPRPAGRRGFAL